MLGAMQKLPLILLVALLALGAVAVPAQALSLPLPLAAADEEADDFGSGAEEFEEDEDSFECTIEDEEDAQLCAEIAAEERESAAAEECFLEGATAKVSADAGDGSVGLVIRYRSSAPASVAIDARLRGDKGSIHLGASHTRFRRSGTFRETFVLGEKRMEKVLAAREFELELQAVNTPRHCQIEVSGALRRAKRSLRAGASDRSGDRGRTRGRSPRARLR